MVLSKTKKLPLNVKMRIQQLGKQLLIPFLAVEIAVMGMGLSSQAQPIKPKLVPHPKCEPGQKPPGCKPEPRRPVGSKKVHPPCKPGQKPPGCKPKHPLPPK